MLSSSSAGHDQSVLQKISVYILGRKAFTSEAPTLLIAAPFDRLSW